MTDAGMAPTAGWMRRLPALPVLWRQTPLSFRIGAIVLLAHILIAASGPFWAPYGFAQMGTGLPLSGMSSRASVRGRSAGTRRL